MKYIALDLYEKFSCLADRCTSTCCSGWKIKISEKDYKRFKNLESEKFRNKILNGIQKRDDGYYFINQANGRCSMLEDNGLCYIQRNSNEKTLCNTCRKYPRLTNVIDNTLFLSMAASCPVVSKYILEKEITWLAGDDVIKAKIAPEKIVLVQQELEFYYEIKKIALEYVKQKDNQEIVLLSMEKLVDNIMDILLTYPEELKCTDSFSFFEKNKSDEEKNVILKKFKKENASEWTHLLSNYLKYRLVSRKLEFPDEKKEDVVIQILGELFMIRTMAYCEYGMKGFVDKSDWMMIMQKTYRLCVHGKQISNKIHQLFSEFFSNVITMYYILM